MTVTDLAKRLPAASEYLSQIYLIIRDYAYCNNSRLAEFIGVSASAVSQAVGRLKRLDLVQQDRYGMIRLSSDGERLAQEILRRHYLLEYLMVKSLRFPWDLADKEAEHLQDKVSDEFIEHLFLQMGAPDRCPHGNPFPGNPQEQQLLSARPLASVEEGSTVTIVRITEEGERVEGLLHACFLQQVMPGHEYVIEQKDSETISMTSIADGHSVRLPMRYGEYIRV